jgi:hypothetical protein
MKAANLNEGVIDIGKFSSGAGDDPASLIRVSKNKRKSSLLDDAENLDPNDPGVATQKRDDISTPQTIQEKRNQQVVQNISTTNRIAEIKALQKLRNRSAEIQQTIQQIATASQQSIQQAHQQVNVQLVRDYNEITGSSLDPETEMVETIQQIEEAAAEIPGAESTELGDYDIVPAPMRKDRSGYTKTLVTIKKSSLPGEVSTLATDIKKLSKGIIKHRIMDMRTIGNTNKTQLRGNNLKLGLHSVVFKPDGVNKSAKGTRFIVSFPDDFSSTKDVIVYIQESRDKFITIVKGNSFSDWATEQSFLAEAIANYYAYGFKSTKSFIEGKDVANPLMGVAKLILKSGGFDVKPKTGPDGKIERLSVSSKDVKNQWLRVNVSEGQLVNTYKVFCSSEVDTNWTFGITPKDNPKRPLTILDLNVPKFVDILHKLFGMDWKMEEGEDKDYFMLAKLTYGNLRKVFLEMLEIIEDGNGIGLKLGETLSQKDTAKTIPGSYAAEGIIGKTKYVEYFILTYLAVQQQGGDARNPAEYITSDEYHEKYSVATRGAYEERKNTILAKEGAARNYHARFYMFQLEYSIGGVKSTLKDMKFEELLKKTDLLTQEPKSL